SQAYERYAYEYIGDIGAGGSIRGLFANYTDLHPHLSMHAKVHPPGPIALLWLMSYVAGRGAMGLSLATIAFGSLSVIPLFFWARDVIGREGARIAAVLFVLMPTIVLFTATSADIAFMPFTLTTVFLFWRAIERESIWSAIGAGIGYAIMSLLSFSLVSVGAFFGFVGLWKLRRRRLAVVQTAALMALAAGAVHAAVYYWSGFNVVESFQQSQAQFALDQANVDEYMPRYPAWTFRFWNPMAWFYFAGIPVSLLFLRRLRNAEGETRWFWLIFPATLLVLDLLYLARGEGERSAMYVMPFLVIPAADALRRLGAEGSKGPVIATAAFLATQCWITEAIFYTYW
ncbi:MAG: glycosyltransferase family 39 protein, partial [Candidatus Hydrogenedentota bacterium]